MVTVFRAHGLRVIISANDHRPTHVQVFGDGEAKINLVGDGGAPLLLWADGMSFGDIRRAMQIVTDHQAMLLIRWEELHGRLD